MNKKQMKIELEIAIAQALVRDVHKTHDQIAEDFGVGAPYVRKIAKRNGIFRKRGKGSPAFKSKNQPEQGGVKNHRPWGRKPGKKQAVKYV